MYEVGPWFVWVINLAVIAFVGIGIMIWVLRRRNKHASDAYGKVLAEVQLPTGRSIFTLTKPSPDGWISLGKLGDYRLAGERRLCKCGHEEGFHEMAPGAKGHEVIHGKCLRCDCGQFEVDKLIPAIRRWGKYPPAPFLGIKTLQVDVRTEAWYLNNPEPITPAETRTTVTAVDAQFHTREMAAEMAAVEIQEQEARQRQLMEAIRNQPHKMVVYIMLGAGILLGIMNIIQVFARG